MISLQLASEEMSFKILNLITWLNRQIIKDPNNLSKYNMLFNKKLEKIVKQYSVNWQNWANNDLVKIYTRNVNQIRKLPQFETITHNDVSKFFCDDVPIIAIPEIKGQVLSSLSGYHIGSINAFRMSAYYHLQNTNFQILRHGQDIFRDTSILAGEKTFKESDIFTRRILSQEMLDKFANKGIQCIKYRDGSVRTIDDYCEMYGRTMTNNASRQAVVNESLEWGYNLFQITSHFRCCHLCSPYEGEIISVGRNNKGYLTLKDTQEAGMWHPACKHHMTPYHEGLTEKSEVLMGNVEKELVSEMGYDNAQKYVYEAQQKQRYYERNIRKWKRHKQTSLSTDKRKMSENKIKYYQGQQRDHINDNSYLRRNYKREQINKAH